MQGELLKHLNIGNALNKDGKYEEALIYYEKSIAIDQKNISALFNKAQILRKLDRSEESIVIFNKIISLRPENSIIYEVFGKFLYFRECYSDAVGVLNLGLHVDAKSLAIRILIIKSQYKLNRYDDVVKSCRDYLRIDSDNAEVSNIIGHALFALKRYEESIPFLTLTASSSEKDFKAQYNLAIALKSSGSYREAIDRFDAAIALAPERSHFYVNRAACHLKIGNFDIGWRDYGLRSDKITQKMGKKFSKTEWVGDCDISGKTVLVHSEFGLGDTIQFCRYVRLLEDRGARVLFAPQTPLKELMKSISETVEIVDLDDLNADFDYHCRMMSLPRAFSTTLETIPAQVPYLAAKPDRIDHWKRVIGADGFKIGVCWRGSKTGDELGLSFAASDLAGLAEIHDVRLINLQKSADPREWENLAQQTAIETQLDPSDLSEDGMLDTAAVISICDLVISCDTSIAHLAGALGCPTWVVMPVDGDWRWLDKRADSPWYPGMRLFRPTLLGSREAVFHSVEVELRQLMSER